MKAERQRAGDSIQSSDDQSRAESLRVGIHDIDNPLERIAAGANKCWFHEEGPDECGGDTYDAQREQIDELCPEHPEVGRRLENDFGVSLTLAGGGRLSPQGPLTMAAIYLKRDVFVATVGTYRGSLLAQESPMSVAVAATEAVSTRKTLGPRLTEL